MPLTKHQPRRLSLHRLRKQHCRATGRHGAVIRSDNIPHLPGPCRPSSLRENRERYGGPLGRCPVSLPHYTLHKISRLRSTLNDRLVLQVTFLGAMNVDLLRLLVLYCSDQVREKCGLVTTNKECFILIWTW